MTRFLFVTWPGGGNQPPTIGLAQELRSRGHDVLVAGYESQRERFAKRGLRFIRLARSQDALAHLSQTDGLRFLLEGFLLCNRQLTEVPRLFTRERADVLVIDCMMFAALTAAERDQLPAAVLIHSPPGAVFHPNRVLGKSVPEPLNALRAAVQLEPVEQLWDTWQGMLPLCASIPALDPLRDAVPDECVYVGPIFERATPTDWRSPWRTGDPHALILVSFSTEGSFNQRSRIERTLAGLATLPVRVLVTSSGTDVRGIEAPDNAVVIDYIPHRDILPEVAVTVTHAGHGTIAASLTHGVPLVCLPNPLIADQEPLADRVEQLGAGRALDGERATAGDIASAVEELTRAPRYRRAAMGLARCIETSPGVAGAAEQLLRI